MKITPKQYAIALYEATKGLEEKESLNIVDNLTKIIQQNNDTNLINKIEQEYYRYYQQQKNISRIKVTSNKKLSKDIMNKIIKNFENQVEIEERVNEKSLGGITLEINENILIDGSVEEKIKKIKDTVNIL